MSDETTSGPAPESGDEEQALVELVREALRAELAAYADESVRSAEIQGALDRAVAEGFVSWDPDAAESPQGSDPLGEGEGDLGQPRIDEPAWDGLAGDVDHEETRPLEGEDPGGPEGDGDLGV